MPGSPIIEPQRWKDIINLSRCPHKDRASRPPSNRVT
ncbi:hypothetical protein N7471_011800 [Penicillium samsonianum]|nr:uncharacterized protein N7471_011800 [Penicillium samsonianum]KAJ6124483.1 hypothetical protein N7471_011800 [Penicillium samsonianum]